MPSNCLLSTQPFHMRAAMRAELWEPYSWFDDNKEATQHRRGYRFVNTKLKPLTKYAEYNKARQTQTKAIHDWAVNKFLNLVKTVDVDGKRIHSWTMWVNRTEVLVLSLNNRYALIILKNLINPISRKAVAKAYQALTKAEKILKPKHPHDKFFRILISPKPQRGGQRLIFYYARNDNFIHWDRLPYTAPKSVNEYAKENSSVDYGYAYVAGEDWDRGTRENYATRLKNLFRKRKQRTASKNQQTNTVFHERKDADGESEKMSSRLFEAPMKREEAYDDNGLLHEDGVIMSEEGLLQEGKGFTLVEKPEVASDRSLPIETIYKNRLSCEQSLKIEGSHIHSNRSKYRRLAVKHRGNIALDGNRHVWVTYKCAKKKSDEGRVVVIYGPYFRVNIKVKGKWKDVLVGKNILGVAKKLEVPKKKALKMCIDALRQYVAKPRAYSAMKRAEAHLKLYEEQASQSGVILDG